MHRLLWKIYKLSNKHLSRRASFFIVSCLELAMPWSSWRPLAAATGTWDILADHPKLASPTHRVRAHLRPTELCRAMSIHGSDKSLYKHNYTQLYDMILGGRRRELAAVFELGIGSIDPRHADNMGPFGKPGASLRGWRDYLPNARIFAADIDGAALIFEDRIVSFQCDQTDPAAIEAMWSRSEQPGCFDLMIDDGMHDFRANVCFLEHSLHKLKPGGLYVVEDVKGTDLPAWGRYLPSSELHRQGMKWAVVRLGHPFNAFDNNLVLIRS